MMALRDLGGKKRVWRIRGDDGKWKELPEGESPSTDIPLYDWSPFISEEDGFRVFHFNMN